MLLKIVVLIVGFALVGAAIAASSLLPLQPVIVLTDLCLGSSLLMHTRKVEAASAVRAFCHSAVGCAAVSQADGKWTVLVYSDVEYQMLYQGLKTYWPH